MGFVFFIVGIAGLFIFFLIIIGMILAVFIPCLVISIVNLVKASKRGWPKRNVIPMAITGSIVLLFILLFIYIGISFATRDTTPYNASSNASSASNMIQAYLPLLR